MCSPEEALADIYLTSLIGSGGFASVYSGLWHGSGHVAVKICCTRPKQDGQFPARVFTEAIICKGLAHPSVIQT
ncbi:protein kinase domain-containing protein [Haematococcus lacustris]|uniref:Protein kinase domain-containing protein n=1 Tax=Haematococcus lacustris TaxID=44745 RepID=A0A699YKH0_HAELA|nr:protein kinase domain-containing protein [Haematococcus lacustris]